MVPIARPAVDRQRREGWAGPEDLGRHGVERARQAGLRAGRVPGRMRQDVGEPLRLTRRVVAGQRVLQATQGCPGRPGRRYEGQVHRRLSLRGRGALRKEVVVASGPVVIALVICGGGGERGRQGGVPGEAGVTGREGALAGPGRATPGLSVRRVPVPGWATEAGRVQTRELLPLCPPASLRAGNAIRSHCLPSFPPQPPPLSPALSASPAESQERLRAAARFQRKETRPARALPPGRAPTSVEGEGPVGKELARLQTVHERPHPARTAEEGVAPGAQRAQLLHPPFLGASVLEPDLKHRRLGVRPRRPYLRLFGCAAAPGPSPSQLADSQLYLLCVLYLEAGGGLRVEPRGVALEPRVDRIPSRGAWASRPAQQETVGVVSNNRSETVTACTRAEALHLPKECQTHGFPFTDPGSTPTPPRMIVTEIQAASCFDTQSPEDSDTRTHSLLSAPTHDLPVPNILVHSLSLLETRPSNVPFTCAQERTASRKQSVSADGSLPWCAYCTNLLGTSPHGLAGPPGTGHLTLGSGLGPNHTQVQNLTARTGAAAWMDASDPQATQEGSRQS